MTCHVYNTKYCKVRTIVCCGMQSENSVVPTLFRESLNSVMAKNGVAHVHFKDLMIDSFKLIGTM
jgi:hypothetical protein